MSLAVASVSTGASPITKPSGLAVGDLMIAVVAKAHDAAFPSASTPSGWTSVVASFDPCSYGIFYKTADSSDVAASDFAFKDANDNNLYGCLYRITGNGDVSFESFNNVDTDTNTTGTVATGITTAHDNSLFIAGYLVDDNISIGTNSTYGLGGSPTFTERYDAQLGNYTTFSVADAPFSSQTVLGNATVVTTVTTPTAILIFGIVIYAKVDAVADPAHLSIPKPFIYQTIPQRIELTPTIYPVTAQIVVPTWTNEPKHNAVNVVNLPKT